VDNVGEDKKTKAELKAEKKVEGAALKQARAEAKAEKKAGKEERKASNRSEAEDKETVESDSADLPEESVTVKRHGNRSKLILIIFAATIPAITLLIMYASGVIVKDGIVEVSRVKITDNLPGLISRNRNERIDFEMSPFFIPLRSGDGIVKLRVTLERLKSTWKKRIIMNPGPYRNVVIEVFEDSSINDLRKKEYQQTAIPKIESKLKLLMEDDVLEGVIVREFKLL